MLFDFWEDPNRWTAFPFLSHRCPRYIAEARQFSSRVLGALKGGVRAARWRRAAIRLTTGHESLNIEAASNLSAVSMKNNDNRHHESDAGYLSWKGCTFVTDFSQRFSSLYIHSWTVMKTFLCFQFLWFAPCLMSVNTNNTIKCSQKPQNIHWAESTSRWLNCKVFVQMWPLFSIK